MDDDIYVQAVTGLIPVILDLRAAASPPAIVRIIVCYACDQVYLPQSIVLPFMVFGVAV